MVCIEGAGPKIEAMLAHRHHAEWSQTQDVSPVGFFPKQRCTDHGRRSFQTGIACLTIKAVDSETEWLECSSHPP